MTDLEVFIELFHPGGSVFSARFEEYMGAVYTERPLSLLHENVMDVSPATVAQRKTRFWGHVAGYHPALVWHLRNFVTKEGGKP